MEIPELEKKRKSIAILYDLFKETLQNELSDFPELNEQIEQIDDAFWGIFGTIDGEISYQNNTLNKYLEYKFLKQISGSYKWIIDPNVRFAGKN